MKLKTILLLTGFLFAAREASAQAFSAIIQELDNQLTTTCAGPNFIPDGTTVQIMWDNDSNGPDDNDPQPPSCDCVAPECLATDVTMTSFSVNGEEIGNPGGFFIFNTYGSCAALPPTPRYWLKVCYGSIQWWSAVRVMSSGPTEWDPDGWTCQEVPCEGCQQPQAPGNFAASGNVCTEITLTWTYPDTVAEVDKFLIYRDLVLRDSVVYNPGLPGESYVYHDLNTSANSSYTYGIEARRTCDPPLPSSRPTAGGFRPPLPVTPTAVSASDGSTCDSVLVQWTYAVGVGQAVDSFIIKRNGVNVGGLIAVGIPGNRAAYARGANMTTIGSFTVVGWTASCGEGALSNANDGFANGRPPVPTLVNATDGLCGTTTITWHDSTGETGYQVFRANNDGSNNTSLGTVGANVTTFPDNGGSTSTVFRYTVVALNTTCGNSNPSGFDNGSRISVPAQVTGVVATDTSCSDVRVTWTTLAGVDSFQVRRDGNRIGVTNGSTLFFVDATGTPGQTYSYTVAAYNSCGPGTVSVANSGIRRAAPGQVTGVTASTNSCLSISISWSATAQADSYLVRRNGNIIRRVASGTLNITDTDSVGTFAYTVTAKNTCGDGTPSTTANGTRITGPSAPGTVAASDDSCNVVRVTWVDVTGEDGYIVRRNGTSISGTLAPNTVVYTDNTAGAGLRYEYTVVSTSTACGNSNPSAPDSGGRGVLPETPASFLATSTCTDVDLTWSAAANADSYDILRDGALIDNVIGTSYSDVPADNILHVYAVIGRNECGIGDTSNTSQGQKLPVPTAPTNVLASTDLCTGVLITWTNPNGAQVIRVYRDGAFVANVNTPTAQYLDQGAAAGDQDYHLVAQNSCGDSQESDTVTGTMIAGPTVPTGLTASDNSCEGITLNWNASAGDVDSYTIRRDGDSIATVPAGTLTFVDAGAADGIHTYTVETFSNECGGTGQSSPANGERLEAPGAVADLTASDIYCDRVELDWSGAPGDVDSFRISRDGNPIGSTIAQVTDFTELLDIPGEYNYTVVAFSNQCGEGPTLRTTTIGTVAAPPTAASNLTATTDRCDGILLEWMAGANLDSHQVYRDNDVLVGTVGANATSLLDTNASDGVHVYYVMAFSIQCGQSDPSNLANGERQPDPPQVQNVSATDNSCESVTITWDAAVGNFDNYRVDRNGAFLAVVEQPTTQYIDVTAAPGITYEYMVRANDEVCGLGPLSVPDEGTRQEGATAPSNLTASQNDCDFIRLEWTESTGGVEEYRIYRDDVLLTTVTSGTDVYVDTPVDAGVEYDYFLRAFSAACGETSPSNTATGIRLPELGQVQGLTASDDNCNGIVLNWTAIVGATYYSIYRDAVFYDSTTTATYTDTSVVQGVPHGYTVAAVNICGIGTEALEAVGTRAALPGDVTDISSTQTNCFSSTVTWTNVANEAGYYFYVNDSPFDTLDADVTTRDIFTNEVGLYVHVAAFNACGLGGASDVDTARAISGAEPPTALNATDGDCDGVLVTWTDGNHATFYTVWREGAQIATNIPQGTGEYLDATAEAETQYTYTVSASNSCGQGGQISAGTGMRIGAPAAIVDLVASQDGCDNIVLGWTDLPNEDGYVILRNDTYLDSIPANSSSFTDAPLAVGTYGYTIYAYNVCGTGPSDDAIGDVLAPPAQVTGVTATQDRTDGVLVAWTDLLNEEMYDVLRDGGVIAQNLPANTTSYLDVSAVAGTDYLYSVQGENACGTGQASAEVTGRRISTPPAPATVSADSTCAGAVITWTNVAGETQFRVYRDGDSISTVAADVLTYTDTNAGNAPHVYGVAACNTGGCSGQTTDGWSPIPVPAAVTNLTATGTCTSVILNWTDTANETGYRVIRDLVNDISGLLPAGTITFTDNTPGATPHEYQVRSIYSCGDGGITAPVPGARLSAPPSPAGVAATDILCPRIDVSWTDVAGETGYRVFRNGVEAGTTNPNVTIFSDAPTPGTYRYTVRSFNACGESDTLAGDNGTRLGVPPAVPAISATENSCSFVRVTWTQVAGVTRYKVLRNNVALATQAGDSSGYTDAGATPGTVYAYSVVDSNQCGLGDTSAVDNGTRLVMPTQPTGIAASDGRCDSIVVTWNAASGDVDWYVIVASADSVSQVPGTVLRYAYAPAAGFTASFTVHARSNECGSGNNGAANNGSRAAVPNSPTNVTTSNPVCDRITVNWTGVTPAPDGYVVYRDNAVVDTVNSSPFADIDGVDDPLTHSYQVSAYNSCGESPRSAAANGNELPLLRLPQGLPDTVVATTTVRVQLQHCAGVEADTVYLSLEGGPYFVVDTIPGNVTFVDVPIPPSVDSLANNRLRFASKRGARVDVLISETFYIEGTTAADEPEVTAIPNEYFLEQNYPNPFNPSTTIQFGVPRASELKLEVYDLTGRLAETLVSGIVQAGVHTVNWDCSDCPTGMYLLRLTTPDNVVMRKMLLMK